MINIPNEPGSIVSVTFSPTPKEASEWNFWAKVSNSIKLCKNPGKIQEVFGGLNTNPYVESFPSFFLNFHIIKDPKIYREAFKYYRKGPEDTGIFTCENNGFSRFITTVFSEVSPEDCLLTCSSDSSSKFHSFLVKEFNQKKIDLQKDSIKSQVDETLKDWESKKTVNLPEETKIFTSSIIGKLYLGFEGSYGKLTKSIDTVIENLGMQSAITRWIRKAKFWNFFNDSEYQNKQADLNEAITFIKQSIDDMMKPNDADTPNFCHKMMDQLNGNGERVFSDNEVRASALVLFLAGQDTTANLLNYIIFKLAQNPDIQSQIQEGNISLDDVIREGIRMFTPATLISRYTSKDLKLKITFDNNTERSWYLPEGTLLAPAPTFMARDPRVVDDVNLDTFNPSRWKHLKQSSNLRTLPWLPFGYGVHLCPGLNLAKEEISQFLTTLLDKYTLSTEIQTEPTQVTNFINSLSGDLPITISPR